MKIVVRFIILMSVLAGCLQAGQVEPSAGPTMSPAPATPAAPASPSGVATSSPASPPPTQPSAESVVREFLAAVESGDDSAAAALLADGGRVIDQDVTRDRAGSIVATWTCSAEIVQIGLVGGTVRARLRYNGGTRPNATADCEPVVPEDTLIFTVRDGRITAIRFGQ